LQHLQGLISLHGNMQRGEMLQGQEQIGGNDFFDS
jgi:hypothetical protein